jgi:hypothetical protein
MRLAHRRLRQNNVLAHIREAEKDIRAGRVYSGDLRALATEFTK